MKHRNLLIMFALLLAMPGSAFAQLMKGNVLLNGENITAEFTKLSSNTVALGSGMNSCISQYSEGRLAIPSTVTISGTTYRVTEIKDLAFRFCNKLTFVDVQGNVTRIGNFAFLGCTSLKEIVLPASLQTIGTGAFRRVPLVNIHCGSATPPVWEYNDVFHFKEGGIGDDNTQPIGSGMHLIVSEAALDAYRNAFYSNASLGWTTPDGWGRFSDYNGEYLRNFRIYSTNDLEYLHTLMQTTNSGEQMVSINLEADVDMSERPVWTSGLSNHLNAFAGYFDGHNHTIRGLQIINHDEPYVGLFAAFAGDTIRNLRLENCRFEGKLGAGSIVGTMLTNPRGHVIENVYANAEVNSIQNVGGLVGYSPYYLTVNNCVFEGAAGLRNTDLDDYYSTRYVGGIVGILNTGGEIKNSAVIATTQSDRATKSGPFIGAVPYPITIPALIQNCYYTGNGYDDYSVNPNTDHIRIINPVVIAKRDSYDFHSSGSVITHAYEGDNMKSFSLASRMGLTKWIYKYNEFPLPVTMEDRWPVEKNVFTLRPADMPTPRINGFSLLEEVPEGAWHSRDETGEFRDFHTYSFQTSRLWFDETIDPDILDRPQIIPLGATTIVATDGIEYVRELGAKDIGAKTHEEPLYEVDEEGNLILDANDQPIPSGENVTIYDGQDYKAVGYSIYLPFNAVLPDVCKVYQPYDVSAEGDATIIKFRQVADNVAEAFTPYYVLVQSDTIVLSTESETVCPPSSEENNIQLGDYKFVGTARTISNYTAYHLNAYILQSDGKWHKVENGGNAQQNQAYIPAFRSFFQASSSHAKALSMSFDDDEQPTGITVIQTTDVDSTERYYDLNGRPLPGRPDHGLYIKNGRKYRAD